MNKLLEKYKVIENKKPIISLQDYNKHRFNLSLIIVILYCINYFHNLGILYPIVLALVIVRDIYILFRYQKEKSDELIQYNEGLSNRIITSLLLGFILIMSIISIFSNLSLMISRFFDLKDRIKYFLDFEGFMFLFYGLTLLKTGLFLILNYNSKENEE